MGSAVCEAVAESADSDARRQSGRTGPGDPAGQCRVVKGLARVCGGDGAGGLAGDDGGNQLAAGRWLRAGQGGGLAVGPALAGAGGGVIEGRGAHGDGDRGDRGGGVGSLVAVVEVAGGGAFDLAGAEPGPAGGQQGGQDGAADDAGQVSGAVRADACRGG